MLESGSLAPLDKENQLIVYTKDRCVQCDATKRKLDELGVEYEARPLAEYPEGLTIAQEHGIASAPVVVAGDRVFSGYRPDVLKEYAAVMV